MCQELTRQCLAEAAGAAGDDDVERGGGRAPQAGVAVAVDGGEDAADDCASNSGKPCGAGETCRTGAPEGNMHT